MTNLLRRKNRTKFIMIDPRYFAFVSVFAFRKFSPLYPRDIVPTTDPSFSNHVFFFSFFTSIRVYRRKILRDSLMLARIPPDEESDVSSNVRRILRVFHRVLARFIELEVFRGRVGRVGKRNIRQAGVVARCRVYNGIQKAHPTAELN